MRSYFTFVILAVSWPPVGRRAALRVRRYRNRDRSGRGDIDYRAPVDVKYQLSSGRWSFKTLGAMEIVVGPSVIEVVINPRIAGVVLGSEWFSGPVKLNAKLAISHRRGL